MIRTAMTAIRITIQTVLTVEVVKVYAQAQYAMTAANVIYAKDASVVMTNRHATD